MDITKFEEKKETSNPFVVCDNYIKRPAGAYLFSQKWRDQFNETLALMFECVNRLEKDESLGRFSYRRIEECLNFLTSLTFEKGRDDDLIDFMKSFLYIAYNINQNTFKYPAVNNKINYLQRYCDNALTYNELVNLLSSTTKRLAKWKEWTPPSFRLSGHYYHLLKEE